MLSEFIGTIQWENGLKQPLQVNCYTDVLQEIRSFKVENWINLSCWFLKDRYLVV